jgi:hypothetical protein
LRYHYKGLIFSPYVVWALVPAVSASLENAVSTLRLIKKPRLSATARAAIRQKRSPNELSHFKLKAAHPKQKRGKGFRLLMFQLSA